MPHERKRIVVRDPVCGKRVHRAAAEFKEVFGGIEYCFCSRECRDAFQSEPARYSARK